MAVHWRGTWRNFLSSLTSPIGNTRDLTHSPRAGSLRMPLQWVRPFMSSCRSPSPQLWEQDGRHFRASSQDGRRHARVLGQDGGSLPCPGSKWWLSLPRPESRGGSSFPKPCTVTM